ncbi:MAG: phenylalanine--tRNA ligase subunit beta, partial [Chloroflexia bacterium]|nr:phenylalanine--tRNA ligase subunit beta [Chloroflexia bacterium]
RPTLIPMLGAATAANLKHERSVRLFEIASVYLPDAEATLPDERGTLGLVVAGDRNPLSHFPSTSGDDQLDFFDLKGIVQSVLDRTGARAAVWEASRHPALHPGRTARVELGGQAVGIAGELRPEIAAAAGIEEARVGVAELDLAALRSLLEGDVTSTVAVPRFLPVQQDFAVVVDAATPAADVERALLTGAGPLATDITLFDVFTGEQIGAGRKSLAYRVTFTAPDRALTDAELGRVRKRIQRVLTDRVQGTLRT